VVVFCYGSVVKTGHGTRHDQKQAEAAVTFQERERRIREALSIILEGENSKRLEPQESIGSAFTGNTVTVMNGRTRGAKL
jgi:hypothetical protein